MGLTDIGALPTARSVGIVDKHGVLASPDGILLDLGCGSRKRGPDYVGVDILDGPDVDVLGDALAVLEALPPASVRRVYTHHFLEHAEKLEEVIVRLSVVIAPGGELEVIVPHFSNPYFHSDPTHVNAFGLYSFSYFVRDSPFKRKVPTYGRDLPFRFADVSLRFKSPPPFYGRYAFKRFVQLVVNASRGMKEFYEENLCYLVPCYEVRYLLVRE